VKKKEFIDSGCLQEINRQLLHPRGLELKFRNPDSDTKNLVMELVDRRDEVGGITYGFADMDDDEFTEAFRKQDRFESLLQRTEDVRVQKYGFIVEKLEQKK